MNSRRFAKKLGQKRQRRYKRRDMSKNGLMNFLGKITHRKIEVSIPVVFLRNVNVPTLTYSFEVTIPATSLAAYTREVAPLMAASPELINMTEGFGLLKLNGVKLQFFRTLTENVAGLTNYATSFPEMAFDLSDSWQGQPGTLHTYQTVARSDTAMRVQPLNTTKYGAMKYYGLPMLFGASASVFEVEAGAWVNGRDWVTLATAGNIGLSAGIGSLLNPTYLTTGDVHKQIGNLMVVGYFSFAKPYRSD